MASKKSSKHPTKNPAKNMRAEAKPPTVFAKEEKKVVATAATPAPPIAVTKPGEPVSVPTPTPSSSVSLPDASGAVAVREMKVAKTDNAVIIKVTEAKALVSARRALLGKMDKGGDSAIANDPEYQRLMDEWRKAAKGQQLPADLVPPPVATPVATPA